MKKLYEKRRNKYEKTQMRGNKFEYDFINNSNLGHFCPLVKMSKNYFEEIDFLKSNHETKFLLNLIV